MTEDIKKALASGDNVIGFLVWYDCENAHVTPSTLKTLFNKYGLDEAHLPESIKPKNAFQKACRQAMAETSTSSDTRRSITKQIVDGMDKIMYGVVDLDINDKAESIEPDFSDRVWLDKANWTVHWEKGHTTSKKVKQIYDTLCGEYTTRDISRMIVEAMEKMAALSMRKAGVVYFVPIAYEKALQALQSVVNDIGQCNMQLFALGDASSSKFNNRMSVANAAKDHVNNKIQDMKDDIADLKKSIADGDIKGKTTVNSIEVRWARFRELKEKCGVLADALKVKAEVLEGELESVAVMIRKDLEEAAA